MKKTAITLFVILSATIALFAQADSNKTDASGKKQGRWVKYDANKKKIYEGQFKDDYEVGTFLWYYPTGQVKIVNLFSAKATICRTQIFYPNKELMAMGKYVLVGKERVKDSIWIYMTEDARPLKQEEYVKGKKNGKWIVYNIDTSFAKVENWKMDVQNGPFLEYYSKKSPKTIGNYVNGQFDGKVIYYYPDSIPSVVGNFKKGIKDGNWYYYDQKSFLTLKENYKDGKLMTFERMHGTFEDYYPSQSLKCVTTYKLSKKDGPYKEYYESKTIIPANVENNESYLEPPKLKISGNYKEGKKDGKWTYYTKDGNIEKTELYKDDVLQK